MGFRFILFALALFLIFYIGRFLWRTNNKNHPQKSIEQIKYVECQVCGIHIPEQESLKKNAHFYCSQDHLNQHTT